METNVVAFVGENENGILRHLSRGLMGVLEPLGYSGHVIELGDPAWPTQLDALARRGIAMAWGHAGVGARLRVDGRCLWDVIQVPFISVLADPPCWLPANHHIPSRYVVNAYLYAEWLRVQRRFIRSPQLSALVAGGLVPNPHRDMVAWRDRPHRMVLVKTGADPEARRLAWLALPRRWRTTLEDAGRIASAAPTGDITDTVLDAAEANGLVLDGRTDILFALMTEVDRYVRDARSTALVRALLDLPVEIYGRGWDHVRPGGSRARFHPAFDATGLPLLYAQTQFMLNTSPNFGSGVHERVAYGLDARCCVVSDQNGFTRHHLAGLPTFFPVEPGAGDLAGQLAALYEDRTDYTDAAGPALAATARLFDGLRYMQSLLALAQEARAAEHFSGYRHGSG